MIKMLSSAAIAVALELVEGLGQQPVMRWSRWYQSSGWRRAKDSPIAAQSGSGIGVRKYLKNMGENLLKMDES